MGELDIYTAMHGCSDYPPGTYVLRRDTVGFSTTPSQRWIFKTWDDMCRFVAPRQLTWLPRNPDDDPVILGCWI